MGGGWRTPEASRREHSDRGAAQGAAGGEGCGGVSVRAEIRQSLRLWGQRETEPPTQRPPNQHPGRHDAFTSHTLTVIANLTREYSSCAPSTGRDFHARDPG